MRDDRPSLTAIYVAFVRALATHDRELSRACRDPYAEALLPRALLPLLRRASAGRAAPLLSSALRQLSLGLTDHLAMRTALIDAALSQGVERGIEQVVLLGAGLDARAHRLAALSAATVFEVDHPATQAFKRRKAEQLPVCARELRYVACDLAQDDLARALTSAGFVASRPALWIWEGVTMYLAPAAVLATLERLAALSAPESLLVLTYLTPELVGAGELLGRWSVRALGAVAEPIRCTLLPEQAARWLHDTGFEPLSDAVPREAAPHFGVQVTRPSSLLPKERIIVAIRQERPA